MSKKTTRDDLADVLATSLNKQFKGYKVAYFLDGSEETPTDLTEWISTGSAMLDLAISNRKYGGIPVGRICELTGLEASGKSLLAGHLLADTQKKGGLAVFIDTENACNEDFLRAIGVNVKDMLYIQLDTVEDIFEVIENITSKVRESNKDRMVTIVVDSVAAATTRVEQEADYSKDGWATSKAIIISKAMRKITQMIGRQRIALVFTNQLRQKLGVMFGDPWTTSGGKALPFHASTRIRLKNVGQIKDTKKNTIGMKMRAQVIKNRLGPPMRHADFELYFESGIDNEGSWLHVMKEHKLVKQGGAWYTMDDHNGKEIKFQSKDWAEYLEDDEFKSYCYEMICNKVVLKYEKNFGIDDVVVEEEISE